MTSADKKRLVRFLFVALVIYLLWRFRDYWLRFFARPEQPAKEVVENLGDATEVPGVVYPNYSVTLPPLSYTPNPYGPVIYNPLAQRSLNIGSGCALCFNYGDNGLIPPQGYFSG